MAIKDIHLGSKPKGGGLVVAVSQDAVNEAMDNFLKKKRGRKAREVSFFRVFDPNDDDQYLYPETIEKLKKFTDGIDPFTANSEEQKALADTDLDLALQATIGSVNSDEVLQVIQFKSNDDSSVIFRLGFQKFKATWVERKRRARYKCFEQDPNNPFYLEYNVNLQEERKEKPLKELEVEAQKNIKELGSLHPDTMFSVQQLYLDLLNATELSTGKIPEGLDDESLDDIRKFVTKVFFAELSKNGKFLLQTTILPKKKNPNLSPPSFQPMYRLHSITPYKKENQAVDIENLSSSTLNYQLSADPDNAPLRTIYPWNWMSKKEADKAAGVMVISNDIIAEYLTEKIEPKIQELVFNPIPRLKWGAAKSSIKSTVERKKSNNRFERKDGLRWVFQDNREASTSEGKFFKDELTITTNTRCEVNFNTDSISITLVNKVHMETMSTFINRQKKQHYPVDETKTVNLYFSQTPEGKLSVSTKKPALDFATASPIEFIISEFIYDIKQDMRSFNELRKQSNRLKDEIESLDETLARSLNLSPWVYPGGNTFSFAKVQFSDFGDLVASINYSI